MTSAHDPSAAVEIRDGQKACASPVKLRIMNGPRNADLHNNSATANINSMEQTPREGLG
jgi:hypothetical protein